MGTMARFVFFTVIVACTLQYVFAINCLSDSLENIMNCNDCIRCGGYWCNKPRDKNSPHCAEQENDNWCPGEGNLEELPSIAEESTPGVSIIPSQYAVTVTVDKPSARIPFKYDWSSSTNPNVHVTILNTTQNDKIEVMEKKTVCVSGKCVSHVSVKPDTNFCLPDGGKYEFVNMRVRIDNVTEEPVVKYHVPCACACSDKVEKNSETCNGKGDFSCGVCKCHKGWSGAFCETKPPACESRRGDLQCSNPYKNDVECSGNGYCGPCDSCICYDDREGSQYFQPHNYCADICMVIANECDLCLHDRPLGKCSDCHSLTIRSYNESLLKERDDSNRKVWVRCEEVIDGCKYEYAAMRDSKEEIFVMKINSCNAVAGAVAAGKVDIVLPTVLGVIAVVAAVTAVAGYMMWKAKNAPMPLSASQYQELEGPEGSAGINPLYKSPTSSYNNPMWKGAKV